MNTERTSQVVMKVREDIKLGQVMESNYRVGRGGRWPTVISQQRDTIR